MPPKASCTRLEYSSRPCIFAILDHLVDGLFSNLRSFDSSRRTTVDRRLQDSFTDLLFGEAVVDGTTGVDGQFRPGFEGNQHTQI